MSPCGVSILTTSAPMSASSMVENGPESTRVRSTTRMPVRGWTFINYAIAARGRFRHWLQGVHHQIAPTRWRMAPAAQHAPSVAIMPALKRKTAMAAAAESDNAQPLMLESTGASNESGNALKRVV